MLQYAVLLSTGVITHLKVLALTVKRLLDGVQHFGCQTRLLVNQRLSSLSVHVNPQLAQGWLHIRPSVSCWGLSAKVLSISTYLQLCVIVDESIRLLLIKERCYIWLQVE